MSGFSPIAIVGCACLLPGAANPAALFSLVRARQTAIAAVPAGRWGVSPEKVRGLIASDRGGYVTHFGDAEIAALAEKGIAAIERLDPAAAWLLHCSRAALAETGLKNDPARGALIVGNLSYPSEAMTRFVEAFWLSRLGGRFAEAFANEDARNRFSSGLPVHLVADALGIEGPAFALDAACASSLYAMKLACDRLHDGEVDFAIAGGIARADDLFIHLGFTALQALSPSGRSLPFDRAADGLVPAEGCALVALKRLADAVRDGDRIHGVIRGIGLSNDGRQNGFLAPAQAGQVSAMRSAYEQSGIAPADVGFVECHATGTSRGDAIEIESLAAVWEGARARPAIGSLKGNIGHTITASGAASLIKMLGAFEAESLPPGLCAAPISAAVEAGFEVLTEASGWPGGGARVAAVSNFGFGGNNAHLLVEAWSGRARAISAPPPPREGRIAIVAMGIVAGETGGTREFVRRLMSAEQEALPAAVIALPLEGLGFPPKDLQASLAQQTALLAAADEALADAPKLDPARTGVFIGMGCDTVVARHGLRLKLAERLGREADDPAIAEWRRANEQAAPHLTAAGVIGTMPNIPANRIHAAKDFKGWGFTVSSEELSGIAALEIAVRALRARELDAALVGAADFSAEPAHAAAAGRLAPGERPGDAAVVFVLMREEDAQDAGILAFVEEGGGRTSNGETGGGAAAARFGRPHAATALLDLAAAVALGGARARVDDGGAWPAPGGSARITVRTPTFSGRTGSVSIVTPVRPVAVPFAVPAVAIWAAASREALIRAVAENSPSREGAVRLALVAENLQALEEARARALDGLQSGREPSGPSIFYGEGAVSGEVAFTFTGAAAIYPGAGRELLLAFPEIGEAIAARFAGTPALARALYGAGIDRFSATTQLTGCALVCQAHAELSRGILGISADAAIGLSSGETNALLAFGVWRDLDAMLEEIGRSGLYEHELTHECLAARAHWRLRDGEAVDWRCWRIAAPVHEVRAALAAERRAYLTIIHAPEDCVIGGDASACARVVERVGRGKAIELGLDMIVHCEALAPFAGTWRQIHTRECFPAGGVRFYSNAENSAYVPTREAAAAAITRQALETVDFPKTIERAYRDGVRVFVEHGPRGILTDAVAKILEGRPHLAVALGRRRHMGLKGLAEAVMQLWAAGVPMNVAPFLARLAALAEPPAAAKRILKLPAHPPDIVFTPELADTPSAVPAGIAPPARTDTAVQRMIPPEEMADYDLAAALGSAPGKPAIPPRIAANTDESPRAAAIADLFAEAAGAHRAFLAQQGDLQDRFLELRAGGAPREHLTSNPASRPKGDSGGKGAESLENRRPTSQVPRPGPLPKAEGAPRETADTGLAGPPRPRFTREDLLIHASGRISEIFGPKFAGQDGFARQVRMPEPPLLLADRVVLIEGEPGSMGRGRVVTETDVRAGEWYMHQGCMAPGAVIESGQADLFLISWLGVDALNRGERVYRLLGCDLTFFGGLPAPGETLRYDIHIDGHAKSGDVRLFFFHYDCYAGERLLLSVREGQAGFFTDSELASSGGVLWDAASDPPKADARLDPPPRPSAKRAFTAEEVAAFAAGDAYGCFGAGFERAAAHQRAPAIGAGKLQLIDSVAEFDPHGGPWKRGYLRARASVPRDAWFYAGHFKNDPCMPGTLMADAATQALAFFMAAAGFTIERDGWRFEPVPGETARFVCRGQVIPDADHALDYEVFVEEIIGGETPAVFAALLCKSDGFKVFGCRRFGLRLVPDWPITTRGELLENLPPPRIVGPSGDVRGDERALLACAWGRPSDAFGALYGKFDGARRAPRLPGPPYHFLTRVLSVDAPPGKPALGATVVSEYDVPPEAWYFAEGGGAMPLAVLTEVLLQPCGWLASYLGFAANRATDVLFRNLDGDEAVLHRAVRPGAGRLRVTAKFERFAQAAGTTIVFFSVVCEDAGGTVMTLKTDFGFFDPGALAAQVGLPVTEEMRRRLAEPSAHGGMDLAASSHGRPVDRLRMLDEITGFWPRGGAAGLGRIRARQMVDPRAWYFAAHFYQDPVQPGSLGLEALQRLARALLAAKRSDLAGATFEPFALNEPMAWRFRGQVTPASREVITEAEAVEIVDEEGGVLLRARGHLWVDGLRIYEMPAFAVRAHRAPSPNKSQ